MTDQSDGTGDVIGYALVDNDTGEVLEMHGYVPGLEADAEGGEV